MSGHNRWSQIKHKKGVTDQKRGKLFSKLLKAIALAAKDDPNPETNARLRAAIEQAKQGNVPSNNIERAVKKSSEMGPVEEIVMEAYGPGGIALIMTATTDNTNRTISEVKNLLKESTGKWADPGSVGWAFDVTGDGGEKTYTPKFPQSISAEDKEKLTTLIERIESHDDIDEVFHNAA